MSEPLDDGVTTIEGRFAAPDDSTYELTLYVSGASDLAARAIANARRLCETYLVGRYHLSVVDVHEDPAALLASRILATPTLVKTLPLPVSRVVGDLSHVDRVLKALDVRVPLEPPISTEPMS